MAEPGIKTGVREVMLPARERVKSRNDIEAQLARIYSMTGGPYSNNPRRIAADVAGMRYTQNIDRLSENQADYREIGRSAISARTDEELRATEPYRRAIGARIGNRKYPRSVYAKK